MAKSKTKDSYDLVENGVSFPIDIENQQLLQLACCDCHLVHDISFIVGPPGILNVVITRNVRETAKRRRALKAA
jgi:hypothetical protein